MGHEAVKVARKQQQCLTVAFCAAPLYHKTTKSTLRNPLVDVLPGVKMVLLDTSPLEPFLEEPMLQREEVYPKVHSPVATVDRPQSHQQGELMPLEGPDSYNPGTLAFLQITESAELPVNFDQPFGLATGAPNYMNGALMEHLDPNQGLPDVLPVNSSLFWRPGVFPPSESGGRLLLLPHGPIDDSAFASLGPETVDAAQTSGFSHQQSSTAHYTQNEISNETLYPGAEYNHGYSETLACPPRAVDWISHCFQPGQSAQAELERLAMASLPPLSQADFVPAHWQWDPTVGLCNGEHVHVPYTQQELNSILSWSPHQAQMPADGISNEGACPGVGLLDYGETCTLSRRDLNWSSYRAEDIMVGQGQLQNPANHTSSSVTYGEADYATALITTVGQPDDADSQVPANEQKSTEPSSWIHGKKQVPVEPKSKPSANPSSDAHRRDTPASGKKACPKTAAPHSQKKRKMSSSSEGDSSFSGDGSGSGSSSPTPKRKRTSKPPNAASSSGSPSKSAAPTTPKSGKKRGTVSPKSRAFRSPNAFSRPWPEHAPANGKAWYRKCDLDLPRGRSIRLESPVCKMKGSMDDMARNWTQHEISAHRRLVAFNVTREDPHFTLNWRPITQDDYKVDPGQLVISCILNPKATASSETNDLLPRCLVSVHDAIFLAGAILGKEFPKNTKDHMRKTVTRVKQTNSFSCGLQEDEKNGQPPQPDLYSLVKGMQEPVAITRLSKPNEKFMMMDWAALCEAVHKQMTAFVLGPSGLQVKIAADKVDSAEEQVAKPAAETEHSTPSPPQLAQELGSKDVSCASSSTQLQNEPIGSLAQSTPSVSPLLNPHSSAPPHNPTVDSPPDIVIADVLNLTHV